MGVRRAVLWGARATLLGGPTVVAFFAGGYFDTPRAWAGLIAWGLAVLAAALTPHGLRGIGSAGWTTLAALGLLAAWTLSSFLWSPIAGTAYHDGERVFLYFGAVLAGAMLLGGIRAWAEPALALGTVVVIGYGVFERLLPGLWRFQHSLSAEGRLEQPLTYWNAMGALAAIGLVLAMSIAGTVERERWVRSAAGAACPLLGLGLYLSFSRGALFAAAAGVVSLLALRPRRATLVAVALGLGTAIIACLVAAPLPWVTKLGGAAAARDAEGWVELAALLGLSGLAALLVGRGGREPDARLRLPQHAGRLAALAIAGTFIVFLAVGAKERGEATLQRGPTRLTTLQSNRYSYWNIAWRAFRAEPVRGVGGGGWAVYWLRYRPIAVGAQDAHSLPIQTAAELGLVGLLFLSAFVGGTAMATRCALRRQPALAAGPAAALVTAGAHAVVDWDWEMPALTLVSMLLIATILVLSAPPSATARAPA